MNTEYCLLSNNVNDYRIVSQGKTSIPGVDDGDEFDLTDVRIGQTIFFCIVMWFLLRIICSVSVCN